jgi:hypothetical protein
VLKKVPENSRKFPAQENVLLKSMGRDRAIPGFAKRKTAEKYLVLILKLIQENTLYMTGKFSAGTQQKVWGHFRFYWPVFLKI